MPQVKLTPEEEQMFLLIKKAQIAFPEVKNFLELFCLCIEKKVFECKGGKKVLHFDKDNKLRQIETQQIDYKT
jgi:hypothetical protein